MFLLDCKQVAAKILRHVVIAIGRADHLREVPERTVPA